MDELTDSKCGRCQAVVPRNLTQFHNLWHESQAGGSTGFFGEQAVNAEVMQMLHVVATLRALPPVTARTEFVQGLRERLMAQTRKRTSRSLSAAAAHCEHE